MDNLEEKLKTKTILIVEDDEAARQGLALLIGRMAGKVYEAADGKAGLEGVHQYNPDIVVTDLEMPVMNGMEMIEHIKAENPDRPVIVVTAFADELHQTPKADKVITKPIDRQQLKAALLEAVARL